MSTPPPPESSPVWPGYAAPAGSYTLPTPRRTSHMRLLLILGAGLVLVVAVVALVSWLITPPPPDYRCPPNCPRPPFGRPLAPPTVSAPPPVGQSVPPTGQPVGPVSVSPRAVKAPAPPAGIPVQSNPRASFAGGEFSVEYPDFDGLKATKRSNGWVATFKDDEIEFYGEPAGNQTPRDIAEKLIQKNFPGASIDYQIPNAMVGYQRAYGEIDNYKPQSSNASYTKGRLLVMVAVKNGFALIAFADGPYLAFTSQTSNGQPSGANLEAAAIIGPFVNTFMWRGDQPR